MKKNLLSLAVAASAAGITGIATAQMYMNGEHAGEALVFPFYSAQGGNDTTIHIVNTTSDYKAVKVRMLEGEKSLETLDFNLYLSPKDHFAFAITADGDGSKLITNDTSCTVPAITAAVPFTDVMWAGEEGSGEAREQIGFIEVIEMGQIDPNSVTAGNIKHSEGTPGDCSQLVANWSSVEGVEGAWYDEASAELAGSGGSSVGTTDFELTWNGGGLYGVATVINVAQGTAFGYDAVAVEGLVSSGATGSHLHYPPGDARPDLDEAASAVFMTESISNDYIADPGLNALTDWIVTMPTKGSHRNDGSLSAPFSNTASAECQQVTMTAYNREEGTQGASSEELSLCSDTSVIHFGALSATNSSRNLVDARAYIDGWTDGWAVLDLTEDGLADALDNERAIGDQRGLPVTGFAVVEYTNGTLGTAMANYQMAWEHKTSVATSSAD